MYKLQASIVINRPLEEVFAFVADNENDTQWCYGVVETTRIAGDEPGPSARYSFTAELGRFKVPGELETVAFWPPERIGWEGASSLTRFKGYYVLKEVEQGTELTIRSTFNPKHIYRLLQRRMRKEMVKAYAKQFRALKALLEEEGAAAQGG